jgi:hypothetical protein
MADNNKTSIDVTVNSDAEKQIDNYVKSFDSLRNSINGLSQPFNSFSNSLNSLDKSLSKYAESLNQINTQNKDLIANSDSTTNKVSGISSSFLAWNEVIKILRTTTLSWTMALTGGLTIITTFLPEIINFVKTMFSGKVAVNEMITNFKSLNEVMKASNKDVAAEVTRLQILYKSATDVTNAQEDRIRSVKELKRQYPDYLKGIKDEDILNGSSKTTYDKLTKSIYENAKAKAALNKMTEEANKMLDADFQIEKIKNANFNEKKRYEKEAADGGNAKKALAYYKEESDKRARIAIAEQEQIKNATKQSIDFLMKFAGGANTIAKSVVGRNGGDSEKTNTGSGGNSSTNNIEFNNLQINNPNPKKPKPPKPDISRHLEMLEAHAVTFTMQLEQDKKHYDNEMDMLNQQLAKKSVSQQEYDAQSVELQDKYHQNISNNIELFNKSKMNEMQGIIGKIVEANRKIESEQRKNTISDDEKGLKKAVLPGTKFDAEKKLIDDKFAYEIFLADGNNEKKKELAIKHQQDITALTQQYEQQRRDFALNTAQQVADKAFGIIGNNIKASSDAKIKGLEKDKAGELSNKNLTATQRKAIEEKYKKKETEEKIKAFKAEQKASVVQAVVNGALAITKATSQTGVLAAFVIPGIIASTALQVATIIAQKPPAFAKGGRFVSDGRGALLPGYSPTDNTNAYLRSGEAVVVSEAMRNPWARNLVSAINVAHGGRDFSMPNTGRGYAIGGIFTDGGNANRYYNQPVNDIKDMANTLAYQMINNFPPIYVDVKDVNNQQNILAQTVNRVNL